VWLYINETNKRNLVRWQVGLAFGALVLALSLMDEINSRESAAISRKLYHINDHHTHTLNDASCPMISCLRPLGSIAISLASSVSLSHSKSLSLSLSLSLSFLCPLLTLTYDVCHDPQSNVQLHDNCCRYLHLGWGSACTFLSPSLLLPARCTTSPDSDRSRI
jgi:hypothetical protein